MRHESYGVGPQDRYEESGIGAGINRVLTSAAYLPRQALVGLILFVALLAFELFNFDTTRYALENLLGDVMFGGVSWAAILAIAFCSIDFAGLVRFFLPENKGEGMPKEVWYLMGAWFLGATMNAMMTWWAVSLTLLNHQFGNEVLGREQLLKIVPIFVAVLVWLTRILFIGAFSVAGERLFRFGNRSEPVTPRRSSPPTSRRTKAKPNTATKRKPAARRAAPRKSPARRPPPPVSLPEVVYVSEEEEEEEFEEMVPGQPTRVAPRPVINPPKAPRPVPNHNRSRNQRHQPVSAPRPRPAPAPRPSRNASRVRQRPPKPVTRRGPISARSTTRGPLG